MKKNHVIVNYFILFGYFFLEGYSYLSIIILRIYKLSDYNLDDDIH